MLPFIEEKIFARGRDFIGNQELELPQLQYIYISITYTRWLHQQESSIIMIHRLYTFVITFTWPHLHTQTPSVSRSPAPARPVGSRLHAMRPSSVMTVPSLGSKMINLNRGIGRIWNQTFSRFEGPKKTVVHSITFF